MGGEQIAAALATNAAEMKELRRVLDETRQMFTDHAKEEGGRIQRIEQQLSFARFVLFFVKALVLTFVAALAFKFGDISSIWKVMK